MHYGLLDARTEFAITVIPELLTQQCYVLYGVCDNLGTSISKFRKTEHTHVPRELMAGIYGLYAELVSKDPNCFFKLIPEELPLIGVSFARRICILPKCVLGELLATLLVVTPLPIVLDHVGMFMTAEHLVNWQPSNGYKHVLDDTGPDGTFRKYYDTGKGYLYEGCFGPTYPRGGYHIDVVTASSQRLVYMLSDMLMETVAVYPGTGTAENGDYRLVATIGDHLVDVVVRRTPSLIGIP